MLAGRVPVGVHVDLQLAHVDFELKCNDIVEPIPLGLDVPYDLLTADERAGVTASTALGRTRTVRHAVHRVRQAGKELHRLAESRALVTVTTATKTKTDVLVVAEAGSQSGKAKKAAQWNKPVIAADEFLDWAHPDCEASPTD